MPRVVGVPMLGSGERCVDASPQGFDSGAAHVGAYGGAPNVVRVRHRDLAVRPDQAAADCAQGAPCLRFFSLVHDTLALNY